MIRYLRALPFKAGCEVGGVQFLLCHAAPSSPLFEYRAADSELWSGDPAGWSGVVLTGHTHLPFQRTYAGKIVVNPGSVGQPKNGRAEACYAVWQDAGLRSDRSRTRWRRPSRSYATFRCRRLSSKI